MTLTAVIGKAAIDMARRCSLGEILLVAADTFYRRVGIYLIGRTGVTGLAVSDGVDSNQWKAFLNV